MFKKSLIVLLKIIITVIILGFLYDKINRDQEGFYLAYQQLIQQPEILIVVLLLMPFNWLMEVLKWRICIQGITKITLKEATKGVLAGVSLGFITPHAIGDYFAKIYSISHQDRKKALGPILVARLSQMIPTVLFGSFAFYLFFIRWQENFPINMRSQFPIWSVIGLLIALILLFYFLYNGKRYRNLFVYFSEIKRMKPYAFVQLFSWSMIRYLIFSLQFVLLLSIYHIPISSFMQFMGIAFMFLAKSILPSFNFLNDLGIREVSAVLFFESQGISAAPVITVSLAIWLINIALPALIGSFFISQLKFNGK